MRRQALHPHDERVAEHDERVACASAQQRLATSASVAFALTVRSLQRCLPPEAQVAALGVGSGQDTPVVAHQGWWRGCTLQQVQRACWRLLWLV